MVLEETLVALNEELKKCYNDIQTYQVALKMACDRLGKLEHDCKGCINEACANYISDEECAKLIRLKYLMDAKKSTTQIVRCKDCIHRDPEDKKCDCGSLERVGKSFPVSDDYYCAYGTLRGDEQ